MKVLFIAPHLSTGGLPQYLYKQIETISKSCEVWCIEWDNVTGGVLVVQRNRIANLLGNRLITLGEKKENLFSTIKTINPDVIHLQEIPEMFMSYSIASRLYNLDRTYTIIETSHDSSFDINNKLHFPDKFLMVSQYQINTYKPLGIPCELVEYPIEYHKRTKTREEILNELGLDPNKKHVITVGLFTPRKNQAEVVEYAKQLQNYPIQFHFIGNQADNFKYYWEPLMKDFPSNCKWWGERSDVDTFYQAADLFLFTSRGSNTDKETMPLVIREAISWQVPSLIYNLDVYLNYFDKHKNIEYLDFNSKEKNIEKILNKSKIENRIGNGFYTLNGFKNFSTYQYSNSMVDAIEKYGEAAGMYWGTFVYRELEKFNVKIEKGDVFVDLGANIGMSSKYAELQGAAELHCFEPDPNIASLLKQNVPSAKIYPNAIDKEEKEIELYYWPYNEVNIGPKYKSNTLTLKNVLSLVNKEIDYLKIDIEGFEENIFDDLTVEECSKIKKLFIEHHNSFQFDIFCNKLKSKGFNVDVELGNGQNYIYGTNKNSYMEVNNFIEKNTNVFFTLSENKITIENNIDKHLNYTVVIKDYLSNHTIYWFDASMPPGGTFWAIPCPKQYFFENIVDNNNFKGYKLDFLDQGTKELLFNKEIIVDEYATNFEPTLVQNPYNCSYINYVEFFCKKYFDDYNIKEFDIVIDAGANDGLVTEWALKKGAKKVYCVEPDKRSVKYLKEKFINDPNVVIVDKALYDKNEYDVKFNINTDTTTVTSLSTLPLDHVGPNQGFFLSETITFSRFLSDYNVDKVSLFKIDIEGAEYDLLKSMTKEEKDKVKYFLIECHWINDEKIKTLLEIFDEENYLLEFRNHLKDNVVVDKNDLSTKSMVTLLATNKKLVQDLNPPTPKIVINHLLSEPDSEREIKSIASISQLEKFGTYNKIVNTPYELTPPSDNCHRPSDISTEVGGDNLTSRHYGCYKAHTDAILSCSPEDNTIYLFFEGDAVINTDVDHFMDKVIEAYDISKKFGHYFFSFGPVTNIDTKFKNHVSSTKLFEAHAYMIAGEKIEKVQEWVKTLNWDVFDLWVSHVCPKQRIGYYEEFLSLQAKGVSLIDKKMSEQNHLGIEKL